MRSGFPQKYQTITITFLAFSFNWSKIVIRFLNFSISYLNIDEGI